jgi:DNA end-binding protein Ku
MARAMWKGSLSFGRVNLPAQLQPATAGKDLHLHLVHHAGGGRIREQRVC